MSPWWDRLCHAAIEWLWLRSPFPAPVAQWLVELIDGWHCRYGPRGRGPDGP